MLPPTSRRRRLQAADAYRIYKRAHTPLQLFILQSVSTAALEYATPFGNALVGPSLCFVRSIHFTERYYSHFHDARLRSAVLPFDAESFIKIPRLSRQEVGRLTLLRYSMRAAWRSQNARRLHMPLNVPRPEAEAVGQPYFNNTN